MVFSQPHREDLELLVAGEKGVERGQVPDRLFHDLGPGVDEGPVHGGAAIAELLGAVAGQKDGEAVEPLGLLVQRPDRIAQVVYDHIGGLGAGRSFLRGGVAGADHAREHADLEEAGELLLLVDLLPRGGYRLRPPGRAQHGITVELQQVGKQARPRGVRRRLQAERLHVALPYPQMVAVPRHRALDDLAVDAGVGAEMVTLRPLLQVVEVAEELEGTLFCLQLQADGVAQVRFEDGGRFDQLGEQAGILAGLFLGLAGERRGLGWLDRQAPVDVDAAELGGFVQEGLPVGYEVLRDRVFVAGLAWDLETGEHAGVLVERETLGQAAESSLESAHLAVELLVGQAAPNSAPNRPGMACWKLPLIILIPAKTRLPRQITAPAYIAKVLKVFMRVVAPDMSMLPCAWAAVAQRSARNRGAA